MRPRAMMVRNVAFALLGAGVLVLKASYAGAGEQVVGAYAGNVFVSFALYFATSSAVSGRRHPRLLTAAITLAAVTAFEVGDGFGIMANVYDPVDLLANALGVGLAVLADAISSTLLERRARRRAGDHPTGAST